MRKIKKYYNRHRHQIVTIEEGAKYLGVSKETIVSFLFIFFFSFQFCYSQKSNYWSQVRYFEPEEFYTSSHIERVDPVLVLFLDEVRHRLKLPIVITSGVRSPHHNKLIGGVEKSDHVTGKAVDIKSSDPFYRAELIRIAYDLSNSLGRPIKVVLYKSHVHLSIATDKPYLFLK